MTVIEQLALQKRLRCWLSTEIDCDQLPDGRVACTTPLFYANGDSVTVWVAERDDGDFEITDYSNGFMQYAARSPALRRQFDHYAKASCIAAGVQWLHGRVSKVVRRDRIPDAVWDVANASRDATITYEARGATPRSPRRTTTQEQFEDEVVSTLMSLDVGAQREARITGASGHVYRTSLYLPSTETVIEPLNDSRQFTSVSAIFTKFSDISSVNGHRLYTVINDQVHGLEEDVVSLLASVGSLMMWSDHDRWIPRITTSSG